MSNNEYGPAARAVRDDAGQGPPSPSAGQATAAGAAGVASMSDTGFGAGAAASSGMQGQGPSPFQGPESGMTPGGPAPGQAPSHQTGPQVPPPYPQGDPGMQVQAGAHPQWTGGYQGYAQQGVSGYAANGYVQAPMAAPQWNQSGPQQGQYGGPGQYAGMAPPPPAFHGTPEHLMYQHPAYQGYGYVAPPPGYGHPSGMVPPYPGQGIGSQMAGDGVAQGPGAVAGHAGQGRGAVTELLDEISSGGNGLASLTKMLNLDDTEFWKGALVGAAAVLLFTNDSVQSALFKTGAKATDAVKTGVAKVRESTSNAAASTKE